MKNQNEGLKQFKRQLSRAACRNRKFDKKQDEQELPTSETFERSIHQKSTIEKFHPIIHFHIIQYLDLRSMARLRLLSRTFNYKIRKAYRYYLESNIKLLKSLQEQQDRIQRPPTFDPNQKQIYPSQLLEQITNYEITEVRAFANPHEAIQNVFKVLYILIFPTSQFNQITWMDCRRMLKKRNFLKSLKELDYKHINNITEKIAHMHQFTDYEIFYTNQITHQFSQFIVKLGQYINSPNSKYLRLLKRAQSKIQEVQSAIKFLQEQQLK